MSTQTRFLNKRQLKRVNEALVVAGYAAYPGDRTSARPEGQGSGYVSNLLDWLNLHGNSERERVMQLVENAIR